MGSIKNPVDKLKPIQSLKILLTDETVLATLFASLVASPSQDCVAWTPFEIAKNSCLYLNFYKSP